MGQHADLRGPVTSRTDALKLPECLWRQTTLVSGLTKNALERLKNIHRPGVYI